MVVACMMKTWLRMMSFMSGAYDLFFPLYYEPHVRYYIFLTASLHRLLDWMSTQ